MEGRRITMDYENLVRRALKNAHTANDLQVIVDSTRILKGEESNVVVVNYHLEGHLGSPGQFTFPFVEAIPLEESVEAFLDYGNRSWQTAKFAPGEPRSLVACAP